MSKIQLSVPDKVARRNRLGLSVQLPLLLDDGRALVVQRYDAATMTCRQLAKGATLQAGETIHGAADKDGSRLRLRVDEVKPGRKRLLVLRVLGRVLPKAAP